MDNKKVEELISTISTEDMAYRAAVTRNSGVGNVKAHLMNVLFNNREVILQYLKEIIALRSDLASASESLAEADAEYSELNKKYRELQKKVEPVKISKSSKGA